MMKIYLQAILHVLVLAAIPMLALGHDSEPKHVRRMDAPENDRCINAEVIELGASFVGSTTEATANDEARYYCGTNYDGGPGVWYQVTGTGTDIIATTCGDATDHDTKITVFSGGCSNLVCIDGNDDSACGNHRSTVQWFGTLGTDYFIHVHGYQQAAGNFGLHVFEYDPCSGFSSARVELPCFTRIVNDQDDIFDVVALIPEITGLDGLYNPWGGGGVCTWTGEVFPYAACYGALVQPNVTTEYCMTVSTQCGTVTGCGQVKVVGACGEKGDKIQVCKVPKGNPKAAKTQCLSKTGFSAKFDKSLDYIGTCELECPTKTGEQCFRSCYVE